jgi:hypothetical protein
MENVRFDLDYSINEQDRPAADGVGFYSHSSMRPTSNVVVVAPYRRLRRCLYPFVVRAAAAVVVVIIIVAPYRRWRGFFIYSCTITILKFVVIVIVIVIDNPRLHRHHRCIYPRH